MRFFEKKDMNKDNNVDITTYLNNNGAIRLNDFDKKINYMNTSKYKWTSEGYKINTTHNIKNQMSNNKLDIDNILRFKEVNNDIKLEKDNDLIMEPTDEEDIKHYKLFKYNDNNNLLRNKQSKLVSNNIEKKDDNSNINFDNISINSIEDIKKLKYNFKQNLEDHDMKDHIGNNIINYKNNLEKLDNIKSNQNNYDEFNTKPDVPKINRKPAILPQGLLSNFILGTNVHKGNKIEVQLDKFKSSLNNIYNKGYADALEDLGMDPRNAFDPDTKDAFNVINDNNKDANLIKSNNQFRFKSIDNNKNEIKNNDKLDNND